MNLFSKNEKTLVKSLIYGLIGGFYFSILFISRTKTIESGKSGERLTNYQYL